MTDAIHHQWKFAAPVLSLCVNRKGDWVAAALGDGSARVFLASDETEEPKQVKLHDGISLSLQPDADAHAFLSGGDDGKVIIIDPINGTTTQIAEHTGAVVVAPLGAEQSRPTKIQWIDHVAGSSDGKFRAYNCGKKIYVLDEEGKAKFETPLLAPSNPGGLSFSPNGKRLAASHYNGVSLWWLNAKDTVPTTLTWKGSHLDLIWSPDGKNILTSLQENALHGWQLADNKEMRMQGYAAKVRSMGFTARGKFLATAGAEQIICWPFSGGGPWGKAPLTLGGRDYSAPRGATVTAPGGADNRLVTQVAPHPKDEMVAAGYNDGMVVLAPLDGRVEIMIAQPTNTTITGLVWNAAGDALFAATEGGAVMLFTIDSVRKAMVPAG